MNDSISAIDIRLGNAVVLKQGKLESEVVHSTDPVFIAKLWKAKGSQRLHIVDLDGALSGTNINKEIIKKYVFLLIFLFRLVVV
jgi:phosphoribosylformimino-5-aminoimidazole carboxamide ribotide isomerase